MRFDLGRQAAVGLGEPALEQRQIGLVAAGEIGRDQIVLAVEMIIQRALGDAGLRRHRVDADAADALAVEQRIRRRDDAFAGSGCGGRAMACNVYRPVNIHNIRAASYGAPTTTPQETASCPTPCCSTSRTGSR